MNTRSCQDRLSAADGQYRQVVVAKPGFFSALVAGIVSRVLKRPLVYILATPFTKSTLGTAWIKLTRAQPLGFEQCDNPDSGYFYGDRNHTAGAVADWLCASPLLARFLPLYQELSNAEGKLQTMVRAYVDQECLVFTHLLGYLSGIPAIRSTLLVGSASVIQRRYLETSGFSIHCLRPPAPLVLISNILQRFFQLPRRRGSTRNHGNAIDGQGDVSLPGELPGKVDAGDMDGAKVLFFPHQTVSYGGLFYKDQFYSDDTDSPFHPRNLLHVELEPVKQRAVSPSLADYYSKNGIRYCYLPRRLNIQDARQIGRSMLTATCSTCSPLLLGSRHRTLAQIQFKALWRYMRYRCALKAFPKARLALIGYEILFPKLLYLALESRGIRTAASQERFHVSVFFENWSFFLDTYFCSSTAVGKYLRKSRSRKIANTIATGFIRTDLLYSFRKTLDRSDVVPEAAKYQKLVVLFDSPVFPDYDAARLMYVANWTCNRAYYQDVIRLANQFPSTLFVIRCKDILWIDEDPFREMVRQLEATPNVMLSREYRQHAFQYKLAAVSDLVISKYSSIGDECLSVGIPTIFHDYTAIQSSSAWRTFDYLGLPVFAHNFESLLKKTREAIENGQHLSDKEKNAAANLLNDRIADGRVRERIHDGLKVLYQNTLNSA